ncbi:MAG: HTH domain-containing protein [Candidatus Berkelbacteria bacterium]|nr:HTH domain-containing protein [Candidatus Berkelbacteria bacterium]
MVIKNFSPYKIVKEALIGLKPNEIKVVTGRFGIDTPHKTLSAIGKNLNLSRERIRQIEKEALRKLAKEIVNEENLFVSQIITTLEKSGGITSHDKIAERFLEEVYVSDKNEFNSLHLIFILMPQIVKIEKTKELEAAWMLASLSKQDVINVINEWVLHLEKQKKPEMIEVLVDQHPGQRKHKITFLSELPLISKRLVRTENGLVGLSSWPEVNPRNVRDKIYFVLHKSGKPMHFDDIAKKISDQSFDKKSIVKATVHNELIADSRFVLVGRGIYGLSEWGYKEGTVADVIKEILAGKSNGLPADEIVKAVLKQRLVKKNTILINLQTKPFFKKLEKNRFALK